MAYTEKHNSLRLTQLTNLFVGCMLSVFLLFPGFHGYQQITKQKAFLFFLLTGGYVFAMLLLRFKIAFKGSGSCLDIKSAWKMIGVPEKFVLGYWLMSAVSTLLSDYRVAAFWGGARSEGLVTLSLYCACFLLVSYYCKPKEWMIWLFAGAVSINCLLALIQLMGYNPLHLYPQGMNYYDGFKLYAGQFLGTIGNVDLLSAVLCAAIPIFAIALVKLQKRNKLFLLIPLCLSLVVLFWAFVSGGVLSVIVSTVLCVPAIAKEDKLRKVLAGIAAALMLLGLIVVYAAGDLIGGFAYEAQQVMHGNLDDNFGSGRIYIWRKSLELIDGHLLFGSGPETMGLRTDAMFERYDDELGVTILSLVDTAHNEYLNVLVNQGLLAFLCFIGAVASSLITWVKHAPADKVAAICGGSVLCYSIQAFFGISSLISAPYFWIALAILCAAGRTNT